MDNSEVDLLQVMNLIWEKKKQILIYTALIVICAVSFSYVQPKYYEAQIAAFILSPEEGSSKWKNALPQEYYEGFSKSPKVLNAVLKNLPKEVRFDGNDTPLNNLGSSLRVQSKMMTTTYSLTLPVLKLSFFVRHRDPHTAYQIADTWKIVLENNIGQFAEEVTLSKYSDVERELKSSKAKWNLAKKRLVDFAESFNIKNKHIEIQSIRRLIESAHRDSEAIVKQMDSAAIIYARNKMISAYKAQIMRVEEQHLSTKDALLEYKRLMELQPRRINSSKSGTSEGESNEVLLNPIYIKLQKEVMIHEVKLYSQKVSLERLTRNLESEVNNKPSIAGTPEFAQNKHRLKMLAEKIKRYEAEASKLEKQILSKRLENNNLDREEVNSAQFFREKLKKNEELELVKASGAMSLDFSMSALEPAIFLGTPMQRIILIAFGSGLIFMILFTLIKASFGVQGKDKLKLKTNDTKSADVFSDEIVHNGWKTIKEKTIVPSQHSAKPLKEIKAKNSSDLMEVGLPKDH